jgi:hypothetical protein
MAPAVAPDTPLGGLPEDPPPPPQAAITSAVNTLQHRARVFGCFMTDFLVLVLNKPGQISVAAGVGHLAGATSTQAESQMGNLIMNPMRLVCRCLPGQEECCRVYLPGRGCNHRYHGATASTHVE